MEYRSSSRGVTGLAFGKPMTATTHRVARSHSTNCLGFNFQTARKPIAVIPGWSAGPDLRCAIAHRGISRFRVRCFASPRNDGVWVASSPQRRQTQIHKQLRARDATRPSCAFVFRPGKQRAWGMPDARCTRGLVCNDSGRKHTSNNEHTGITRHSRTQWF